MGQLLKDKADQNLSFAYMVYVMMTDNALRSQPLVIVVAVVLVLVDFIMPIVQIWCLSRSLSYAGKNVGKSKYFLDFAEFFGTFDCTELCLVMLLVFMVDF